LAYVIKYRIQRITPEGIIVITADRPVDKVMFITGDTIGDSHISVYKDSEVIYDVPIQNRARVRVRDSGPTFYADALFVQGDTLIQQQVVYPLSRSNTGTQMMQNQTGGRKKTGKIHTGPKGGNYIIKKGKKVYV
jgi:hypothetical protein